ncbi:ketohydroxyglutarate aldolase [Scytonema sp. UIC 10036]|uniref:ketohydroxyglutarate aldolase n=1 Tax=Scytonema sp. UIC 10036 TaxID=2304196 RepID=UPI0012DA1AD4|nr:ketohydroxyglutarate aldolase [Scytonema sp. UIC 10036]MUG98304.1 ketohydroxyglutarate aldolase [Scytonema sp. UIC 10036]
MSTVNIVVSVDDEHLHQILDAVTNLQAAGMSVENVMPEVGVISGSVDSTQLETLSQIEGVAAVEISRNMRAI